MSSTKITQLTPGQEQQLANTYQQWLEAGRGCAPLDRKEVTEICAELYRRIGKPAPTVLFLSSPIMCILAWGALRGMPQLESQLESQLGSQLWSQLGSQLGSQLTNYYAGQHSCAWEVFYAFCGEIGVRYTADQSALLDLWIRQSRSLHWWFPYDGIVLASERHTAVRVDDRGRLHAAEGMACAYSDGWGIYAWHGVNIPAHYYYTGEVTPAEILAERNIEVRRALIERYDEQREKGQFMLDCGAKVLDTAIQPMRPGQSDAVNELLAIELPDDPEQRMVALRVIDPSTDRSYIIRVPPDQRTVQGALAWSFNVPPAEYKLLQES